MNLFQLYLDAAALPDANQQQRFIDALAQKSAQLANKLKALLADSSNTLHLAEDIRHTASRLQQLDISANLTGQRLGYWQLDSIIAHGGMSTVYLASRQDGQFEQQVAIKVLNPLIYPVTADSQAFAEANVAAKLNHPGITKVFDAGITENHGQQAHYIVMEYIDGQPLNRWLENTRPTVKTLVQLFIELCDALHYAHTHQIIHADLKPENILVDEHGKPKLIDFGIARLQLQDEQTPAFVQHYVKALSRHYASPEQLQGESLTTLSDVYSLGKVLQFCCTAFHGVSLQYKELPAIAMKATTEPRFSGITELKQQLVALLAFKPVTSYSTKLGYVFAKFIRRHPARTVLSALLAITLLVTGAVMTHQYQRLKAETFRKQTVLNFIKELFSASNPALLSEKPLTLQQVLQQGSMQIDNLLARDSAARLELKELIGNALISAADFRAAEHLWQQEPLPSSTLTLVAAKSIFHQGRYLEAQQLLQQISSTISTEQWREWQLLNAHLAYAASNYQEAERLYQTVIDQPAKSTSEYRFQAQAFLSIARSYEKLVQFPQALSSLQQAEKLITTKLPNAGMLNIELLNIFGTVYTELNMLSEAKNAYQGAYGLAQKLLGPQHPLTAEAIRNVGLMEEYLENFDAAISAYHQAEQVYIAVYGEEHQHLAYLWNDLGIVYRFNHQHQEAVAVLARAENVLRNLFGDQHADLASILGNKGVAEYYLGNYQRAYNTLKEALHIDLAISGDQHSRTATRYFWLAFVGSKLSPDISNLDAINKAIAIYSELFGPEHLHLLRAYRVKASLELSLQQPELTLNSAQHALSIWTKQPTPLQSEALPLYHLQILAALRMNNSTLALEQLKLIEQNFPTQTANENLLSDILTALTQRQAFVIPESVYKQHAAAEQHRLTQFQQLIDCNTKHNFQFCSEQQPIGSLI